MDGVEEVIRIRIIKFDKQGRAHWSGMYGQPHSGAWVFPIPDLEVGDELVVALEWKLTAWVPNRIVNAGGRSIVRVEKPAFDDEETWVPGFENSDEPIDIGISSSRTSPSPLKDQSVCFVTPRHKAAA
jgi:hypothetical protein